jgi:ArsR family metal-binding transcriptional regulator
MLLKSYTLKIEFPPCDFSAQTVNAIAELSDDISEVLPYLNTIIKGCTYFPGAGILRFNKESKVINLYPNRIAVAKLKDKREAEQVIESLKKLINDTYSRRSEIKPSYEGASELKVRDIYNLLPGTNCKQCGLPTCFAFAAKLIKRQVDITKCTPIYADQYVVKRERLMDLLRKHGYP